MVSAALPIHAAAIRVIIHQAVTLQTFASPPVITVASMVSVVHPTPAHATKVISLRTRRTYANHPAEKIASMDIVAHQTNALAILVINSTRPIVQRRGRQSVSRSAMLVAAMAHARHQIFARVSMVTEIQR